VSSSNEQGAKSGGARPGLGVGTSVGRRRWRRMRSITEASSISAINRRRQPSLDCAWIDPSIRSEFRRRAHAVEQPCRRYVQIGFQKVMVPTAAHVAPRLRTHRDCASI